MRYLGLDYGDKTIGVAVSDPDGRIAVGIETIRRPDEQSLRSSLRRLAELAEKYKIEGLVLGYPKRMDNTEGERCEKTLAFKARLERNIKGVPVILWDERLSTAGVLRTATEKKRLNAVDEMAAVYILQGYLDSLLEKRSKDMNENDDFEGLDDMESEEDSAITMFDEDGNETRYNVLSSREEKGVVYLLVEEALGEDFEEDAVAEVLHFKCVATEDDEMVFELVDEDHEDFDKVFALFKDDYEAFGIEC